MQKRFIWLAFCALCVKGNAQELFVFTEPASNMATNSLGVRLAASAMKLQYETGYNLHLIPELMYGLSNKIMLHANAFLSNRNTDLVTEGGSLYLKYKFLNHDQVQQHFRMAAFARYSFNNSDIHQAEINLFGHNTGYEGGIVATQLLHKLALSASASFLQAMNNGERNAFPSSQANSATNYTLSVGRLVLPVKYENYEQVNVNLMCELLGQTLLQNGKMYLDIAPSVQFIFSSKARIDVAYRQAIYSTMYRTAPNGFFLRLEYNFFNV